MSKEGDKGKIVSAIEQGNETLARIQRQVLEALRKGEHINLTSTYSDQSPLGDTIIEAHAFYLVLTKFAERHGLKDIPIHLSQKKGYPLADELYEYIQPLPLNHTMTAIEKFLYLAADVLDIQVTPEMYLQPPLIYRLEGHPALEHFSNENVVERAKKIQEEFNDEKELIVVCQAGSKVFKRFSDFEVEALEEYLKTEYPEKRVVLLRDTQIRDLELLAAYFYLAKTIITTDTSWSWVAGSVRALQESRQKPPSQLIVFHPVTNDYWHVPGSDSIYGPATLFVRSDDERSPGLLPGFEYRNYVEGRDLYDMTHVFAGDMADVPISAGDFAYFFEKLEELLK
jgi:hypothetical protein